MPHDICSTVLLPFRRRSYPRPVLNGNQLDSVDSCDRFKAISTNSHRVCEWLELFKLTGPRYAERSRMSARAEHMHETRLIWNSNKSQFAIRSLLFVNTQRKNDCSFRAMWVHLAQKSHSTQFVGALPGCQLSHHRQRNRNEFQLAARKCAFH